MPSYYRMSADQAPYVAWDQRTARIAQQYLTAPSVKGLAEEIGLSESAVNKRAALMGLERPKMTSAERSDMQRRLSAARKEGSDLDDEEETQVSASERRRRYVEHERLLDAFPALRRVLPHVPALVPDYEGFQRDKLRLADLTRAGVITSAMLQSTYGVDAWAVERYRRGLWN